MLNAFFLKKNSKRRLGSVVTQSLDLTCLYNLIYYLYVYVMHVYMYSKYTHFQMNFDGYDDTDAELIRPRN